MAPQRTRPGRSLAFVLIVLVGLYAAVFFGDGGHGRTPVLGIDLRGGAQVTLTASPIGGTGTVSQSDLTETVNILRNRVDGAGVGGADIHKQGNNEIIVTVPGGSESVLNLVSRAALLSFRQVLELRAPAQPASSSSSPTSGTATTKATTKATTQASAKATAKSRSKSNSPDVVTPALLRKHGKTSPSSSSSSTPSATLTPTPAPTPSGPATSVKGGVIKRNGLIVASPNLADVEKTFGTASFSCSDVQNNPVNGDDVPQDYILSCDQSGTGLLYLLAPSTPTSSWKLGGVEGNQVSSASSSVDQTNVSQYDVNVNWKSKGQAQWQALTAAAYNAPAGSNFTSAGTSQCSPPTGCNEIAIVLDGQVVSAPASNQKGGIPGGTQITGSFSQTQASQLADVLNYGSLPLQLKPQNPEVVSATLGSSQLRGGLIAGVISLILVALFSLVYYRALGIVTIASLVLSGLILYAVTTLLGHSSLGYTLSLAGIAGFIVAVGITADSFVVFFERLRDEVREGRRLRSGVERAWPRARRTIISADAVSLLAAVILYIVSISDVRGFAFTLGLSTLSDLFIVFLFTKPLLTVLARRRAFDTGAAWTGVARSRSGRGAAALAARGSRSPRPPNDGEQATAETDITEVDSRDSDSNLEDGDARG